MNSTDPGEQLRNFWNERYAAPDYAYGEAPNGILAESRAHLPATGRALCLAEGEGRNAVWLAEQGLRVTAVDIAEQGMAKARALAERRGVQIETRVCDLREFDPGVGAWEVIVSVFAHLPPQVRAKVHARCVQALVPGGVFVYIGYAPEQLGRGTGGPADASRFPTLDDIVGELAGLDCVQRFHGLRNIVEGRFHTGDGWVNVWIGRKP